MKKCIRCGKELDQFEIDCYEDICYNCYKLYILNSDLYGA